MAGEKSGNGQKKWWILGPALTIAGIVFGAGGVTYTTRAAVAQQGKCIEALTAKTTATEIAQARIEERLKSIDCQLTEIKAMLRPRTP